MSEHLQEHPPSVLIDTHAHLDDRRFQGDIDAVIDRARQAGVTTIINPGANVEATRCALDLARRFPCIRVAAGISPHDVDGQLAPDWCDLDALARCEPIIAVGEVGLEYHYFTEPGHRQLQRQCFRAQLELAAELDLPVIIHCREAHAEMQTLLREHVSGAPLRGVMHCFSGTLDDARAYLDLGLHISFTGVLTFKNATGLREIARQLPLDRVLIETDSPYMAPQPVRGKRCEPAHVRHVAEQLAGLHGLPLDEVARITSENARELFRIAEQTSV